MGSHPGVVKLLVTLSLGSPHDTGLLHQALRLCVTDCGSVVTTPTSPSSTHTQQYAKSSSGSGSVASKIYGSASYGGINSHNHDINNHVVVAQDKLYQQALRSLDSALNMDYSTNSSSSSPGPGADVGTSPDAGAGPSPSPSSSPSPCPDASSVRSDLVMKSVFDWVNSSLVSLVNNNNNRTSAAATTAASSSSSGSSSSRASGTSAGAGSSSSSRGRYSRTSTSVSNSNGHRTRDRTTTTPTSSSSSSSMSSPVVNSLPPHLATHPGEDEEGELDVDETRFDIDVDDYERDFGVAFRRQKWNPFAVKFALFDASEETGSDKDKDKGLRMDDSLSVTSLSLTTINGGSNVGMSARVSDRNGECNNNDSSNSSSLTLDERRSVARFVLATLQHWEHVPLYPRRLPPPPLYDIVYIPTMYPVTS